MSRRDAIRMTDAEIGTFLRSHWLMVMGTNGKDGFPHLVTIAYKLWGDRISFSSYRKAQKIKNLERDPRISCLVETVGEQYGDIKAVLVHGAARLITDAPEYREWRESEWGQLPRPSDEHAKGAKPFEEIVDKRLLVVVEPERVTSWDHSRLGDSS